MYYNTSKENKTYEYKYQCQNTHECAPFRFVLAPGCYYIELYGASGGVPSGAANAMRYPNGSAIPEDSVRRWGGNALSRPKGSSGGAGGHVRGTLCLRGEVEAFLHIGGRGGAPEGGYNGGGSGSVFSGYVVGGGGGGATDLRLEADDPWHRVMVAAGGGGADDDEGGEPGAFNDGSGGCGGGLVGQGMWFNGVYKDQFIATQTHGFSFFQGEAYESNNPENTYPNNLHTERSGAGGGWFGGFSGHEANAGSGGGSSFVLHSKAMIPEGQIPIYTERYVLNDSRPYAFTNKKEYFFTDFSLVSGIWSGNGLARISSLEINNCFGISEKLSKNLLLIEIFGIFLT